MPETDRPKVIRQSESLIRAGDLDGAIELIHGSLDHDLWPGHRAGVTRALAAVYCLRGDLDAAIATLSRGLAEGLWWARRVLENDQLLAPLRGRPDFKAIVAEGERRRASRLAELAGGDPEPVVYPPATSPIGVLIALHGAGASPPDFALHWRLAAEWGWLVIVPASSQLDDSDELVGWSDRELASIEIACAHRLGAAGYRGLPTVIAGFSDGAQVAVSCCLAGLPVPTLGVLAVCPGWYRPDTVTAQQAAAPHLRSVVLRGERELNRAHRGAEQLCSALRAKALTVRLDEMAGVGHEIPPNFSVPLFDALDFLTRTSS